MRIKLPKKGKRRVEKAHKLAIQERRRYKRRMHHQFGIHEGDTRYV
jgi:hypothetical protein